MTLRAFNDAMEASHRKQKYDAELARNVILNALYNVHRGKGKPFLELFEQNTSEKTKLEIISERIEFFGPKEVV